MYKFTDWFIEYMKHIDTFCNIKNVINKVCTDDVLKGHYEILDQHSAFISCSLSLDKNAVPLLEKHPNKICWTNLSSNPNAINLLSNNLDKIDWYWLSINIGAKEIIKQNIDKLIINYIPTLNYNNHISWKLLHYNYEAIEILDMYKEFINWSILSYINNEKVIDYLSNNIAHINWMLLSFNDGAHSLFINYPKLVNWKYLSLQPFAIDILTNNQDKIDWDYLSFNENAIDLLKNNYDKINWRAIMFNKNGKTIIENNLDHICWTEWKIFTKLLKKIDKLDKRIYTVGVYSFNNITDITYELKQNYKNNLNYFGKCFVYESLINIDDIEIINETNVNFYLPGINYSLLLREKTDCVYPEIFKYKENYIKCLLQTDKSFAVLIKEITDYIGPPTYNPIHTICNNNEFKEIVQNNPDKIEWLLKFMDSFGGNDSLFLSILDYINIITFDYQKMSIERTRILREELMMKVWHPLNVAKWLNSGIPIDDL